MPAELAEFWSSRYDRIGHTGWKNTVIYAYDQIERLATVSAELDAFHVEPLTAIDFGCGTGDFCRLMLGKGFKVWGYDPYVKPEVSHRDFAYVTNHTALDTLDSEVGLILSVTVLDHILNDQVVEAELAFLRAKVSERGLLLMMEYALDEVTSSSSAYRAARTVDAWHRLLSASGWQVSGIKPVCHPYAAPSAGFLHYQENWLVRLAGIMSKYGFLHSSLLIPPLTKYAQSVLDRYGIGKVDDKSPLKLMSCRPV